MQSELIQSVRALAEAQKNCWASKWPSERVSDTVLGADTRRMVDDGTEEGACEGGLDPVAEGDKTTLDFLEAALRSPLTALLAALERAERIEALLKRGTQAGISNYPNQFVHFSYEDGQEIAALSEPQ